MASGIVDRLDWTLVRSFLAVIDAGSITAAARATGARQPTLSRHLGELEVQLGAPLFERTGRGVVPTAAALAVLPAARQMQSGAEGLARAARRGREATQGTVRITTSEVAACWLLPPIVAALQREEPGIAIEIVASNLVQNLLRREADIALRMVRPVQGSLVARRLADIGIGAYAHRDYLAHAGAPSAPHDLLHHRLIGYDRDDAILNGMAAMGMKVGPAAFAVRTDHQVANAQLVAAGAGIGFVTHYCAAQWPGMQRVLPDLDIPAMPCWIAVHRELRGSGVVRRVFEFLVDAVPARLACLEAGQVAPAGRRGAASRR